MVAFSAQARPRLEAFSLSAWGVCYACEETTVHGVCAAPAREPQARNDSLCAAPATPVRAAMAPSMSIHAQACIRTGDRTGTGCILWNKIPRGVPPATINVALL